MVVCWYMYGTVLAHIGAALQCTHAPVEKQQAYHCTRTPSHHWSSSPPPHHHRHHLLLIPIHPPPPPFLNSHLRRYLKRISIASSPVKRRWRLKSTRALVTSRGPTTGLTSLIDSMPCVSILYPVFEAMIKCSRRVVYTLRLIFSATLQLSVLLSKVTVICVGRTRISKSRRLLVLIP